MTREQVLADLRRRIDGARSTAPATAPLPGGQAVSEQVLAVPGPLGELLPRGGLPRGGVVSLAGDGPGGGSSTLLLSLLSRRDAAPSAPQAGLSAQPWTAVVGMPELGLLAAAELGVDLDRLALVPDPGPDVLHVLSVLADGIDLLAVAAPPVAPAPARLRVLTGRLRQHGTVLLVSGPWPGADLRITAHHTAWSGVGQGHGRLRDRELAVTVTARRSGGHREGVLLLAGNRDGTVVPTRRQERRAAVAVSA